MAGGGIRVRIRSEVRIKVRIKVNLWREELRSQRSDQRGVSCGLLYAAFGKTLETAPEGFAAAPTDLGPRGRGCLNHP